MAKQLVLGRDAIIGSLTVIKGLSRLELGDGARLGNLNWITAVPANSADFFKHLPQRDPSLTIGREAAITHRHLIDCTGGVTIGAFATFAGWHSQIISHSFDFRAARQDAAPIRVGEFAFVGSRCTLLKGSSLPDRSMIGAGSVYELDDTGPLGLYRGNPAERVGDLPEDLEYFRRTSGFIS
ncbi:acyltransferase [Parerythrobacter jejuensis]|uniref:Acyltransferase n=1 Tax=Parerythrobacter jejuensis TaxID=795812 RepID=A0A845API3_9SPHN|nr:acyltransferase [Parerythrobacter jejuensis]MXP31103.1 acyltransferase [Parerythrobacter jejuensis]MXP33863.1 acyltransferase [Parerythrobacter jejuensis]